MPGNEAACCGTIRADGKRPLKRSPMSAQIPHVHRTCESCFTGVRADWLRGRVV